MKRVSNFLRRIWNRLYEDITIIRKVKNCGSFLLAKLRRKPVRFIKLRNGAEITSPDEIDLNFLFHEIWIERVYNPRGYEIKAGDTVIDIGGNIGMFAIFAATREPAVKVFSFEPFPDNAAYFRKNLQQGNLKSITLSEKAVAANTGKRYLNVSETWISHSLGNTEQQRGGLEVDCTSLNEILLTTGQCDLLKTDCEGSEYEILYATSTENLKRIHKIVGEYHKRGENSGQTLMQFLRNHSFRIDIFRELDENIGMFCATNLNFAPALNNEAIK